MPVEKPTFIPETKNPEDNAIHATSRKTSDLSRKLRMMEDRYSKIKKKTEFNESSLINTNQEFNKELKILVEDINSLKQNFLDLNENIDILKEELSTAVSRHEFKSLQKYVDYWNPFTFLTEKDLEKYIKEE
jgi:predicted RNase H-like nuclease (RuvC/YqgF family)